MEALTINYNEILINAREVLGPLCSVCKECNGVVCKGRTPGVGGKGTGNSFIRNYEYLSQVKIVMDTIYTNVGQDTEIELFGKKFAAPIFAAPIGGFKVNYNDLITELDYANRIVMGTVRAGCAAFTGDGAVEEVFNDPLIPIKQMNGIGIPTIKPWENETIFKKIRLAEEAGVLAIAMDIDSAGLVHLAKSGKLVSSKSVEELEEIIAYTKLPFIIKGIMSVEGALKVVNTGAYGIVVSNHGGRVLDNTLATCEVLPEIRWALGDQIKIFVDGGIRTGADVFKALALGADAVLIGRPYATMVFGNGADAVELYTNKLIFELKEVMIMTGCKSLNDITRDKIVITK